MKEHENDLCLKTKEQLDFILEAGIDARLSGDVALKALKPSELSSQLETHLHNCGDCQSYQLANRVLVEAARELPKLAEDKALTDSIMMAFDQLVEAEGVSEKAVASPGAIVAKEREGQLTYLKFAASFIAFILVGSGISADSIWSAGAWLAALLMVSLLKPLLETRPLAA